MSEEIEESLFHFINKEVKHVRCDYEDCDNLTNMVFKIQDVKKYFGKITPSYDVFVKLCPEHVGKIGIRNLGHAYVFGFMTEMEDGRYYCICQRCEHKFIPSSFPSELYSINKEYYGRLVNYCPKCNQKNWKTQRYRPIPETAFLKGETASVGEKIITNKILYNRAKKERQKQGGEL